MVDHGHFHGKIVRVYPERTIPVVAEIFGKPVPPEIDQVAESIKFCTEKGYPSGTVCKVVMVSRMGDLGLSKYMRADHGYDLRLDPECLEIVSEEERPRLLHEYDVGRLHPNHRPRR